MSYLAFIKYIKSILTIEKNEPKYKRIKEANKKHFKYYKIEDLINSAPEFINGYFKDDKNFTIEVEQKIGELQEGDQFGEIALISNSSRSATIIANTYSILAIVNKEDYQKIIKLVMDKEYDLLSIDLRKQPFFKSWPKSILTKLIQRISKIKLKSKETLFEQDQTGNKIYILVKGEIKLTSILDVNLNKEIKEYILKPNLNPIDTLIKKGGKIPKEDLERYIRQCGKLL